MPFKRSKNRDELCYPFIHETSWLCDYEVATDELCDLIAWAMAATPSDMPDIIDDLDKLQPMAFHLNGSIRGKLAVEESDLDWLHSRLAHYKQEAADTINGFILPRGEAPIPQLHSVRSATKKIIRLMVRLDEQGIEVADILPRYCNLLCNFCFVVTLVVNKRRGITEIPFISKSYGNYSSK